MHGGPIDLRQSGQQALDALVLIDPTAGRQLQRAAHAALGQPLQQRPPLGVGHVHLGG